VVKPPDERRRELMDAARELFLRKGYEKTSVREIVKLVKAAQGTFYWYFESKQEVLLAIFRDMMDRIVLTMRGVAERTDLSALDKLGRILDAVLAMLAEQTDLVQSFNVMANAPLHDRVVEEAGPKMLAVFTSVVHQGVAEGVFCVRHPEAAAAFVLTLQEKIFDEVARRRGLWKPIADEPVADIPRELREALWDFILGGLGVTGARSGGRQTE
jgi:AcrR family transcriptional regulator